MPNKIKNQAYHIPIYTIFILLFFIATDILTTYLASPDLKLEANPIILYFGKNWTVLYLFNIVCFLFQTINYVIALNYLKNNNDYRLLSLKNLKSIFSKIVIVNFYYYIIFSFLISINNYFIHLWLHTSWKPYVNWFVMFVSNNPTFYLCLNLVGVIFGVIIFIYQVKKTQQINTIANSK